MALVPGTGPAEPRAAALALRAEAERYRCFVLGLLGRFGAAVGVSTLEGEELRRTTQVPGHVIAIRFDTQSMWPAPEPAGLAPATVRRDARLPPNAQGIGWFANRVWPAIRRELPTPGWISRDAIRPRRWLALGRREGIDVVGPVAEIEPYFACAHLVVVTMLTGAGICVKIVEAMANERAVVTRSLGWDGLSNVEPDRHFLAATQAPISPRPPCASAGAGLRAHLATEPRALAEQHCDWRGLDAEQEAVLAQLLEERSSCQVRRRGRARSNQTAGSGPTPARSPARAPTSAARLR